MTDLKKKQIHLACLYEANTNIRYNKHAVSDKSHKHVPTDTQTQYQKVGDRSLQELKDQVDFSDRMTLVPDQDHPRVIVSDRLLVLTDTSAEIGAKGVDDDFTPASA